MTTTSVYLNDCATMCLKVYDNIPVNSYIITDRTSYKAITSVVNGPNGENAIAFISQDEDELFFVIRGTQPASINDILSNMDIRSVKFGGIGVRVHAGYKRQCEWLIDNLLVPIVNQYNTKIFNKSLIFTGHSLGGAVAEMLRAYTYHTSINVPKYIGFGAPQWVSSLSLGRQPIKPGFDAYNDSVNIVSQNDPVPAIASLVPWFKSTNNIQYYARNATTHAYEVSRYNSVPFIKAIKLGDLYSHSMKNYNDIMKEAH